MTVPTWWEFLLGVLAVYRLYRLVALDTILDRPRDWLLAKLDGPQQDEPGRWEVWLVCPWCVGWWLAVVAWLLFLADREAAAFLAVPLAASAVVGLLAKLDPP